MKNTLFFTMVSAILLLSGCATQPSNLESAYVPVATYADHDCEQLASEANSINRRLGDLYTSLKKKADNDAIQMGVGVVLFWPTLFALEGGDGPEASEYSRLKGENKAIHSVGISKKCPLDSIPEFRTPENFKDGEEEEDAS